MKNHKYRGIIVCGGTGSGKTSFIKSMLKEAKGHKLIYDVNNEYKNGLMMEMDKFLSIAKSVRDHFIVFEEATIFFSNKGDNKDIAHLLVTKRHRNNKIVFVFHNLQAIPKNILAICDLMVLFNTSDNVMIVEKNYGSTPNIANAYFDLKNVNKKYDKRYIRLSM